MGGIAGGLELTSNRDNAIRFLVESALKSVATDRRIELPKTRREWVDLLVEALVSDAETQHHSLISAMMASGISTEKLCQQFYPAAARRLGEHWVHDRLTFVQVTIGTQRLQSLIRDCSDTRSGRNFDQTVPLGQCVLMVLPETEDHTLGAFVAADSFRRHGISVRMAIRMRHDEVVDAVAQGHFGMIGVSVSMDKSFGWVAELVDGLRSGMDEVPPVVVGGLSAASQDVLQQTGADFAVHSVREAIERCALASVADPVFPK